MELSSEQMTLQSPSPQSQEVLEQTDPLLQLQSNLWWSKSSDLAARVLQKVFCDRAGCRPESADRWTGDLAELTAPLLISNLERPLRSSRVE